ncbi:MAG: hypothetical protein C0602_02280 [Denitrovibrio sp.]|nr:MAG: hypothetical protein C0602_02280 [Denitrovibrio sp.]
MIERLFNRYTYLLLLMIFLHIITISVNGILSYFDFLIILFILTMDSADEENYIWMALLFGFFSDFIRDGFYGPGVALFMFFYITRFRTEVIMDMSKMHYKMLLYGGMSYTYCFYNLILTKYPLSSALYISTVRTIVNLLIVFAILTFFKGFKRAVKNS